MPPQSISVPLDLVQRLQLPAVCVATGVPTREWIRTWAARRRPLLGRPSRYRRQFGREVVLPFTSAAQREMRTRFAAVCVITSLGPCAVSLTALPAVAAGGHLTPLASAIEMAMGVAVLVAAYKVYSGGPRGRIVCWESPDGRWITFYDPHPAFAEAVEQMRLASLQPAAMASVVRG